MFVPNLLAYQGWALAVSGDLEAGVAAIEAARSGNKAAGVHMLKHVLTALLAESWLDAGRLERALATAEEGLSEVEATTERWYEAELHRLRGEALAGLDRLDESRIAMESAIAVAQGQGAVTLQRRAEASLAQLLERS